MQIGAVRSISWAKSAAQTDETSNDETLNESANESTVESTVRNIDFETLLKSMAGIGTASEVSEEQLFATIIGERLQKLKGDTALQYYQQQLSDNLRRFARPSDGFASHEKAAKAALKSVVDKGMISKEEAESLLAQSFKSAQLDDNHEALYDSIGGAGDPTMATAAVSSAINKAQELLVKFDNAEEDAGTMALDYHSVGVPIGITVSSNNQASSSDQSEVSNTIKGVHVDGPNGFLFKPISDSDGRLAVLTPERLTGKIERVILRNQEGKVIEEGRYSGVGNGDREHFRFTKPGNKYPDNLVVEVQLAKGGKEIWEIDDPSKRYD